MKKSKFNMTLFEINCLQSIQITDEWELPTSVEKNTNLLLFVSEGKGELRGTHLSTSIEKGDLFSFCSEVTEYSFVVTADEISIYYIAFSCAEVCRSKGEWRIENKKIPVQGKMNVGQNTFISYHFTRLYDMWRGNAVDNFKIQSCFSEIWEVLFTGLRKEEQKSDPEQAIIKMTTCINEHYEESFEVERMAKLAGMNVTSFYQRFKEYTALTPVQYITKTRMEKARTLLTEGTINVHETARAVGYQDAYYFSRVFKKVVGIAPLRYQQLLQRKIVVLAPVFIGDLLALGIPRERIVLLLDKERQQKHRLGISAKSFQFERLRMENPELIIGTEKDAPKYESLAEIAPTYLISYKQKTWREQFIQLASIIDAEEVALNWLRFYDLKASAARDQILQRMNDETILVARIANERIRIFGEKRRKAGDLLYRDLKLQAPIQASGFSIEDVNRLEELDDFNADHILLLHEQHEHDAYATPLQGKVHRALINPWLSYSALGQAQALNEAVLFFAQRKIL